MTASLPGFVLDESDTEGMVEDEGQSERSDGGRVAAVTGAE